MAIGWVAEDAIPASSDYKPFFEVCISIYIAIAIYQILLKWPKNLFYVNYLAHSIRCIPALFSAMKQSGSIAASLNPEGISPSDSASETR